jgi:hypothetical protein
MQYDTLHPPMPRICKRCPDFGNSVRLGRRTEFFYLNLTGPAGRQAGLAGMLTWQPQITEHQDNGARFI